MRDDPELIHAVVHSLNQWLDEVWSFNYKDRIFTVPVISLPIVDKAIEELNWVHERGARAILVRPAPVPGFRGPRSFALPEFDPFWKRVSDLGLLVAMHSSDSGYARYSAEWDGTGSDMLPFVTNTFKMAQEWRPVQDAVTSWVCHGALFRHPELKVAVIENGSVGGHRRRARPVRLGLPAPRRPGRPGPLRRRTRQADHRRTGQDHGRQSGQPDRGLSCPVLDAAFASAGTLPGVPGRLGRRTG